MWLKEQNGFRTWHAMEGRGCVTSCSVYSRIFLKFIPRCSCGNKKVMVMFGLFQNSMKMQKTLHRDLHRKTLSLVMDTGQRSCNCVASSKEARTKSANCSYNPSRSQWLPKEETPAWWEALLVLDKAFKQHSHTWLRSFIRSTTGSFKKSKIQ